MLTDCEGVRIRECNCQRRVCVCVHPDAKLRVLGVTSSSGAEEAHRALPNEALYGDLRILGLIIPAYLHTAWQPGQAKNLASRVSLHCIVYVSFRLPRYLPARVASPRPTTHSANLRSEYPPEEWLGSNYLGSNIHTTPPSALAIQDTPPGDLRPCSTPDQQPPTNISHHYATPLPPTTSPPPPDNTHATPPFTFPPPPPPPPPVPRVIEPMLSPFRPTVGGIAGFLQHASHANIPPPSSLTPTSST